MRDGALPLLVIGGGALGALALRPKRAEARSAAPRLFELGRPTPPEVRTVVSSGWARPRGDRLHRALDIPLPVGTPICAVDSGVVSRVQREDVGDAGRWIGVRHPSGLTSRYIHLSRTLVTLDDQAARGEVIGFSLTRSTRKPASFAACVLATTSSASLKRSRSHSSWAHELVAR